MPGIDDWLQKPLIFLTNLIGTYIYGKSICLIPAYDTYDECWLKGLFLSERQVPSMSEHNFSNTSHPLIMSLLNETYSCNICNKKILHKDIKCSLCYFL